MSLGSMCTTWPKGVEEGRGGALHFTKTTFFSISATVNWWASLQIWFGTIDLFVPFVGTLECCEKKISNRVFLNINYPWPLNILSLYRSFTEETVLVSIEYHRFFRLMIFFVSHHPLKSQYHWTLLTPRSLIHLFSKCFGCLMQVSAQWDVCNWRHMREEIVVGGLKSEKFTPHCVRVSRRMHKGDIYWHSCCFWKEICWLHFYSLLTDYFYLSKITPIQQLSSFSCCRISSTSKISILLKTFHSSGNPILNWIPNRISLFTY